MSMDFALEIDWGSKTEQEFHDGSVSDMSAVLASHRRRVCCNALLCRLGRCPIKECERTLMPGRKRAICAHRPLVGPCKVWICAACELRGRRQLPVSRGLVNSSK